VARVGFEKLEGILHVLLQTRHGNLGIFTISRYKHPDQIDFARKMVMDAGLADPDDFSNIGIAEAVISSSHDQCSRGI
jgi:hypothetical protein